ncbi:hypothetical protein LP420_21120 [Massilia sp. B-10]|nr:hypothetical protein LP420_21120 [Massilia sp. B-10]
MPASAGAVPARRSLVKPPRLRFGDTIGLVAPGGHTDEEGIARATARIEQLGFRVKVGANLRAVHGNYGGTVRQRSMICTSCLPIPRCARSGAYAADRAASRCCPRSTMA